MKKKRTDILKSYLDIAYELNYKERPVSISQFVKDPYFLGKTLDRGRLLYPAWHKALREMFDDDSKLFIVLTGAIGTGKSTTAVIAVTYIMYRLLCLRDMWGYFKLAPAGKMSICFFNLTKSLSESRGFGKLQSFLLNSPWFLEHPCAVKKGSGDNVRLEFTVFRYLLASPYARGFGMIGEDVICGILDEIDSPNESPKQKGRVLKAFESAARRFESRFVRDGYSIGKLFLVASKQTELSFIETFIAEQQGSGRVLVYDLPLWAAKPKGTYSSKTFPVAVGDRYKPSKIITKEEVEEYKRDNYKIIYVPEDFRRAFELDIVGALRDIAGISINEIGSVKYIPSDLLLKECIDETKPDPVKVETIELGLKDEVRLIDFVDLSKLRIDKSVPRCIHCDIAIAGDALGLAMSGLKGWTSVNIEKPDGTYKVIKAPVVETDFVMRIKAKEGDRIPLFKVREFILDLKARGFNINFTADLKLASEDTFQILQKSGINCEYLSVDKKPDAYEVFKGLIYEKRWVCHNHEWLKFELLNLEVDSTTGKVDHPEKVKDVIFLEDGTVKEVVLEGSKDVADAVVGSVFRVLQTTGNLVPLEDQKKIVEKFRTEEPKKEEEIMKMYDDEGKEIVGYVGEDKAVQMLKDIMRKLR